MSLVLLNVAPFFCLCASRIIIATVAKQKFHTFDDFHLSIPILLSTAIFPINKLVGLGLNEDIVLGLLLFYAYFNYFWYIFNAINQICQYLDINCLTIKPKTTKV